MIAAPPHTSPQSAWTVEARAALLAAVPFFAPRPPATSGELATLFRVKTIPRGDFVFHEGQLTDTVHIAATGRLKIICIAARSLALSRQDLADLTGTTLSTASPVLSGWHRRGFVLALRERVTILEHAALSALAGAG